jgi:hypothetical protein
MVRERQQVHQSVWGSPRSVEALTAREVGIQLTGGCGLPQLPCGSPHFTTYGSVERVGRHPDEPGPRLGHDRQNLPGINLRVPYVHSAADCRSLHALTAATVEQLSRVVDGPLTSIEPVPTRSG